MSNNVRKIICTWCLILGTFVLCLTVSTGRAEAQELFLTWGTTEVSDSLKKTNPEHLAYPDELADQVPELFCISKLLFRVSDTCQVLFAPGNLQYNAAQGTHRCADGSTAAGSWRFAPNQWEFIGVEDNRNASSTYDGWIDLFAWGSSGYDDILPYINSLDAKVPFPGEFKDIAGTNYDWGVWCGIGTDAPGTWRTLTREEWDYLFNNRENAGLLYGSGSINDTIGIIILPDGWEQPAGVSFDCNAENAYTEAEWRVMESAGAFFLPCAGIRLANFYDIENSMRDKGLYWSASCVNAAGQQSTSASLPLPDEIVCWPATRTVGASVRLVQTKRIIKP